MKVTFQLGSGPVEEVERADALRMFESLISLEEYAVDVRVHHRDVDSGPGAEGS